MCVLLLLHFVPPCPHATNQTNKLPTPSPTTCVCTRLTPNVVGRGCGHGKREACDEAHEKMEQKKKKKTRGGVSRKTNRKNRKNKTGGKFTGMNNKWTTSPPLYMCVSCRGGVVVLCLWCVCVAVVWCAVCVCVCCVVVCCLCTCCVCVAIVSDWGKPTNKKQDTGNKPGQTFGAGAAFFFFFFFFFQISFWSCLRV